MWQKINHNIINQRKKILLLIKLIIEKKSKEAQVCKITIIVF